MNQEQIEIAKLQLLSDGYCLIDEVMPQEMIERLSEWSDDWLDQTKHPDRWKYQGSDIHISGIQNRSRRAPELPGDELVDFLIEHPRPLLDAMGLDDFKSGGTYQIISKPAGAPALYWHQDWARWDDPISMSPWPQQVFLNWYLSDTTVQNGCIRVIPNTHLRRIDLHDHLVQAHESGGYDIEETNEWMFFDHEQARDIPVKAGQLLIGDARMLHGTRPNKTQQRRTVLLGWYYRRSNEVPDYWSGQIPAEIQDRDPEFPMRWNRKPGEYLRA